MQLVGQRDILAPPHVVWAALLDADVLKSCVPGCQDLVGTPETGFEATVVQKVGPVKATFKGNVTLSDMVTEKALVISGQGKGGPAGYAKGNAQVSLTPIQGGTQLTYDVEAKVGGKLAQLGSRIIDGFAKKMADQFFETFQTAVEDAQPESDDQSNPAVDADSSENPDAKKNWFGRLISG
jgi:carbon monoxide dehydrogenase subunit G